MFDSDAIVAELARNRAVFSHLLIGKRLAAFSWRQAPGKWNLLEIVCHLYDEEREDFRPRVQHALESRDPPPPIDPQGWVTSRNYAAQDYEAKLADFLGERTASIAWLHSLRSPRWDATFHHPQMGQVTARMFLANWLAHDHLHLRQIIRLEYERLKHESGEDLRYAGEW
jgi:hypothetical protein